MNAYMEITRKVGGKMMTFLLTEDELRMASKLVDHAYHLKDVEDVLTRDEKYTMEEQNLVRQNIEIVAEQYGDNREECREWGGFAEQAIDSFLEDRRYN